MPRALYFLLFFNQLKKWETTDVTTDSVKKFGPLSGSHGNSHDLTWLQWKANTEVVTTNYVGHLVALVCAMFALRNKRGEQSCGWGHGWEDGIKMAYTFCSASWRQVLACTSLSRWWRFLVSSLSSAVVGFCSISHHCSCPQQDWASW